MRGQSQSQKCCVCWDMVINPKAFWWFLVKSATVKFSCSKVSLCRVLYHTVVLYSTIHSVKFKQNCILKPQGHSSIPGCSLGQNSWHLQPQSAGYHLSSLSLWPHPSLSSLPLGTPPRDMSPFHSERRRMWYGMGNNRIYELLLINCFLYCELMWIVTNPRYLNNYDGWMH